MAIKYNNLDQSLKDIIPNSADVLDRVQYIPGKFANNFLTAPSDITADDTVTIGTNVFQCKALTTDSTRTGSLANASIPAVLTASGAMTWAAGDLLRLENEIVKIYSLVAAAPTTQAVVLRARCGTTAAAHATVAIYQASAVHATNIPFGVNATLTPAVWVPSLVAEINNALQGGLRATAKASTIFDPYVASSAHPATDAERAGKVVAFATTGVDGMYLRSAIAEASTLATTEGLTAAGNVWTRGATMLGGAAAAQKQMFYTARVPTAAEVTRDSIEVYLPFTPTHWQIEVRTTATGIVKAWNGGVTWDSAKNLLVITNAGATDWSTAETIYLIALE